MNFFFLLVKNGRMYYNDSHSMERDETVVKKIPNMITVFRLILLPVFLYCYFAFADKRIAFAVFVIASASDLLDGYLAPKLNAVSSFGKLADPLADKCLQVSAIVCLAVTGYLPLGAAIIIAVKELVMLLGGIFVLKKMKTVVYANRFGKLTSFFFSLTMCLCFFRDIWFYTEIGSLILNILVYTAIGLSVLSMVQYGVLNVLLPLKRRNKEMKT